VLPELRPAAPGERLVSEREDVMEFLVEFEVEVPEGTGESDVEQRSRAERAIAMGGDTIVGLRIETGQESFQERRHVRPMGLLDPWNLRSRSLYGDRR
jgi:hypothetical protein